MRFLGSPPSNADDSDGLAYGTGEQVKKVLEQQRQEHPKILQHLSAPNLIPEGISDDQPAHLLKDLQLKNLVPGHYTDSQVQEEQRAENKGHILAPNVFPTPEDFKSEEGFSEFAAKDRVLEPEIAKAHQVETSCMYLNTSDTTEDSSFNNCQSILSKKISIFKPVSTMKLSSTADRHGSEDSAVNGRFSSPVDTLGTTSKACSNSCTLDPDQKQTGKPITSESKSAMDIEELSAEQANGGFSSDALVIDDTVRHADFVDGHSSPKEYFKMESPAVPAQKDRWIDTNGYSSSTSPSDNTQDHDKKTNKSSASLRAAKSLKPTRRLNHQARRNLVRRAEEAAVKQQNKRNKRRLRGMKVNHKVAELTLEERAMKAFPGITAQKALKAYNRREQARVARAQEPDFIFDEQRLIMEDYEAKQQFNEHQEQVGQLEQEEEQIGWMMNGGFGGGFGDDVQVGGEWLGVDDDFVVVDGLEDQDGNELAWMEGDDSFVHSSLAFTPPRD